MNKAILTVLTALALPTAGWCGPAPKKPAPAPKAAPPAIDIRQWPAFKGAVVKEQFFLSGKEIMAMAGPAGVKPEETAALKGLGGLQVITYTIGVDIAPAKLMGFYEPKLLGAGYKLMLKHMDDPDDDEPDAVGIYTHPTGGFFVIAVGTDDEAKTKTFELTLLSIRGDFGSLAGLAGKIPGLGDPSHLGALGSLISPKPTPPPAPAAPPAVAPVVPDPNR